MKIQVHRIKPWQGECEVFPDRLHALETLFVAAQSRSRTVIDKFPATSSVLAFEAFLQECGCPLERLGNQVRLDGVGLRGLRPQVVQSIALDNYGEFLRQLVLSQEDQEFRFVTPACKPDLIKLCQEWGFFIEEALPSPQSVALRHINKPNSPPKPDSDGFIAYQLRNLHLFKCLQDTVGSRWEERFQLGDSFARLLQFFGAPLEIGLTEEEEMDELQRRLARLQGRKADRNPVYNLHPCQGLQGRETFVASDVSLATALALSSVIVPSSQLSIRSPSIHQGRAGGFSALRRMGADIDFYARREKYGDHYAGVRVQYRKRLMGRKIAGELLLTCLDEIPLLAVAAAFADGESILRLPAKAASRMHNQLEALSSNLKTAGVEVGIFEEGLVIRGREEPESGKFNAHGDVMLGLALTVLAAGCPGVSTITCMENTLHSFPQLTELFGLQPAEEAP